VAFLQHYTRFPPANPDGLPIECTMQASGLLYGAYERGLDDAAKHVFGITPPKALQTSCWSGPKLSAGQCAYAAGDAVLTYRLWPKQRESLQRNNRMAPYLLQARAITAVAAMELRGVGFDPAEHARQVAAWNQRLIEVRSKYTEITSLTHPVTPGEIRAWLRVVAADQIAQGKWPATTTGCCRSRISI